MPLLIDLSAWARSGHADAVRRWRELVEDDRLRCHPVFALELLHNATTPAEYRRLRVDLETAFDWIWPDDQTVAVALSMQQRVATGNATGQRVKTADLLIAALATQHGVGIVHYNADYDAILERGGERFHSEWLAPRGSLETAEATRESARKAYRRAFGARLVQLTDDQDLAVWPQLIAWLDEELRRRGLDAPPAPSLP